MYNKQPLNNQTLYAELMEQVQMLERFRGIGFVEGSFIDKELEGKRYAYFQYYDIKGKKNQIYLGKSSAALDALVAKNQADRKSFAPDMENIDRLCSQLRAGGALITDHASGKVIRRLAESGVFRLGGVLVGTHAFIVLGNLLGVYWEHQAIRTFDVDIANGRKPSEETQLTLALPRLNADIPAALESLEMGFVPIPGFSPKDPSFAFKVRGSELRVDVLTNQQGSSTAPVFIPRFKAGAQPVPFFDYLIENPVPAVVINGGGTLVNVPDPARYAVHKLIVWGERTASFQVKKDKDLFQAYQLLSFLQEERPGDIAVAMDAIAERGVRWKTRVKKGLASLQKQYDLDLKFEQLEETGG